MMDSGFAYLLFVPGAIVVLVSIWIMIGLTRFFFFKIYKEITAFGTSSLKQKTIAIALCLVLFAYSLTSTDFFAAAESHLLTAIMEAFFKFLILYVTKIVIYDIVYITILKPMMLSLKGDITDHEAKAWLSEYKDFIACLPFMEKFADDLPDG